MSDPTPAENTHEVQAAHALSDKDVRQFLRKFYYLSNAPPPNHEFNDLFTEDGVYTFADRKAKGHPGTHKKRTAWRSLAYLFAAHDSELLYICADALLIPAIQALREKLWQDIPHRDHSPIKIFSYGNHNDDTELMILGTTTWTYHEGHGNVGDWAAHCKLVKRDAGEVKCSYYQIITVCANCCLASGGNTGRLIMHGTIIGHGYPY